MTTNAISEQESDASHAAVAWCRVDGGARVQVDDREALRSSDREHVVCHRELALPREQVCVQSERLAHKERHGPLAGGQTYRLRVLRKKNTPLPLKMIHGIKRPCLRWKART